MQSFRVALLATCLLSASVASLDSSLPTKVDEEENVELLRTHALVYNGNCPKVDDFITSLFDSLDPAQYAFRQIIKADQRLSSSLGIDTCERVVCLEHGTPLENIQDYQEQFDVADSTSKKAFMRWFTHNCQAAEVGFLSYHTNNLKVDWISPEGERHAQGTIGYGERQTMWRTSYLGHRFQLTDAKTGEIVLDWNTPYTGMYVIGEYQLRKLSPREIAAKEKEIEKTLKFEYDRSRDIVKHFTERGFEKAWIKDLRPYVWGSIRTYYYNNKYHGVAREEWDNKGLYVNWWESEPQIMPIPWGRKSMWHESLQGVEEDWIGGEELERTDIYGIRIYNKGARLLSHVDRIETHAASMILNIAQVDVTKPWLVEIYDHSDHLHEIEMNPGNLVYYESAACLHARMNPLASGKYVNMFIHYRPKGDEQWFKKPNTNAPTPVTTTTHISPFVDENRLPVQKEVADGEPSLDCSNDDELSMLLAKDTPSDSEKNRIRKLWQKSCKRIENDGTRIHLDPLKSHSDLMDWWRDGLSDLAAIQGSHHHTEL